MIDLHLHTTFSPDGSSTVLEYFDKYDIKLFIQTDHAEFFPGNFRLFDFKKYDEYRIENKLDILKGVEIGFHPDCKKEIKDYIEEGKFDVVLMSLHNDGEKPYFKKKPDGLKFNFKKYLELLNDVLSLEFDVLSHIDYPFRYNPITLEDIKLYEEEFKIFFKNFITSSKYLELNTSSVYKAGTKEIYFYLFDLYYSVGGRKVSLGSDCHNVKAYKGYFDEALEYLGSYEEIDLLNKKFS